MSLEHDPPGYSQPTLPPSTPSRRSKGVPLIGGGLAAVAALTVAAYALLPHGEHVAAAAPAAPVTVQLETLVPPASPVEGACVAATDRVPIVLRSAIDALATKTPSDEMTSGLFLGTAPATEPISATRVAVLQTVSSREPQASFGDATPGRYEGTLVVFDAATHKPLCQSRVVAWSSSTAVQSGISAHVLHEDFANRIHSAISEAAARMHVELDY